MLDATVLSSGPDTLSMASGNTADSHNCNIDAAADTVKYNFEVSTNGKAIGSTGLVNGHIKET